MIMTYKVRIRSKTPRHGIDPAILVNFLILRQLLRLIYKLLSRSTVEMPSYCCFLISILWTLRLSYFRCDYTACNINERLLVQE